MQIQEEQIKSVYHKNFNYIITERFFFQQQWLHTAYNRFKDFDKYLILIPLVHKTFKAYGDYQIKNSFDEFYAKETEREMCFIGGGAGMAPMRSHIFDQLKRLNSNIYIIFCLMRNLIYN